MKNEFIVLEQPKSLILSVIVVDSKLPMSEENHRKILELSNVSDLFFIFPEKTSGIKPKVFASLYKACGYIEAIDRISEVLMRTLEYEIEIFGTHSLILSSQTSDLPKISDPEKLQRLCASDINKPIFKMRSLKSEEFFNIYKEKCSDEKHWMLKYFPKTIFSPSDTGTENLYCSETIDGSSIIVRPNIVKKWIKFWKNNPGYVYSFTMPDQRYLLASMCKKLNIDNLNIDINELKEI